MRRLVPTIALALAIACTSSPPPSATPATTAATLGPDRIQLLHTDDIHGHLDSETVGGGSATFVQGGLALVAAQVKALRARGPDRTVLVDGGDTWQGTFISNSNKGEAVTKAMTLMKYDALAVGNHDFDWGQDVLAQRSREAGFPFLATNVTEKATGKLPAYLKPYVVKDLGIAKVGILGVTSPLGNTIVKATSVAGLTFGPAAQVQPFLSELQRLADIIVVVAHIGSLDAAQLARDVPGIDVIVAAHDHAAMQTARVEGKTTIVDSGAYTQYMGRLEIVVDLATHKMKDAVRAGELIAIAGSSTLKPDPEIAAIADSRRAEADKYTSRVVGTIKADLDNPRDENGIGNLIGDAFVEYGQKQGWKTDVAFYNAAGVRAPLRAGPVTYGQLYQVLPFENTIVSVDLTGAQLREVLEDASGRAGRLQIGGGRWAYRFSNEAGKRVLEATIAGEPLDLARVYHVATIDYLLLGGDGHTWFAKGTHIIYGDIEVDAVAAYMTAHSPLDPKVEGRMVQR
ncbi:MAG TPA: bifunctional UDP-sugar hydrolase/5'-nucleotidase [Candidatus Limnocylindrales bacterium]|nr:bifunctional UDP-sugar hydrolase/5'-nucleotidase [Candidatus Limnocylindrales bacterium]